MDSLPPFVILLAPFVDGPALVQIITDPPALSMPPTLTGQQLRGFALALSTVVLNGGAATVVVGTQFIGVAPPAGHISPYCDQAYQCIQPLSDPLTPCGARSLVRAAV
jgi:hypothetical protein